MSVRVYAETLTDANRGEQKGDSHEQAPDRLWSPVFSSRDLGWHRDSGQYGRAHSHGGHCGDSAAARVPGAAVSIAKEIIEPPTTEDATQAHGKEMRDKAEAANTGRSRSTGARAPSGDSITTARATWSNSKASASAFPLTHSIAASPCSLSCFPDNLVPALLSHVSHLRDAGMARRVTPCR